uniref:Uncharacterized protein n=1 Tax=Anguilla anguilla TaxID=7936 RepID=A0A0E9QT16_ANGAN
MFLPMFGFPCAFGLFGCSVVPVFCTFTLLFFIFFFETCCKSKGQTIYIHTHIERTGRRKTE